MVPSSEDLAHLRRFYEELKNLPADPEPKVEQLKLEQLKLEQLKLETESQDNPTKVLPAKNALNKLMGKLLYPIIDQVT